MATTATFTGLPVPGSDDHHWTKAYQGFLANNDAAGYLAYLQQNFPGLLTPAQGGTGTQLPGGGTTGTGTGTTTPGVGANVGFATAFPGLSIADTMNMSPSQVDALAASHYAGLGISGGVSGASGGSSAPAPSGSAMPPAGGTTPVTNPVPTPAPAGSSPPPGDGVPTPGVGTGTGNQGTGSGSGTGWGGNAGGAQGNHGGLGISQGGNAAGGQSSGGANTQGGGQSAGFFNFGPNQGINLGSVGSGLLSAAATAAPFPYGLPISLAQAAMRGFNVANGDAVRGSIGLPGQSIGQVLGAILGLNNRGDLSGNQTFANNEGEFKNPVTGANTAVTAGGMYDQGFLGGGPFGIFSDMRTAYTPEEARLHQVLAAATPTTQGGLGIAQPSGNNMVSPDGLHAIPQAYVGTRQAAQYGYDQSGNYVGGSYGNNGVSPGGNFNPGQGAPGTVAGGQYGNQDTGGMAGPVNRNDSTGMLSRI